MNNHLPSRLLTSIFLLLSLFASYTANSAEKILNLSDTDARKELASYFKVWLDESGEADFKQALHAPYKLTASSSYGHSRNPVWSRISIKNDTDTSVWYIQQLHPLTAEISLFALDSQGNWSKNTLRSSDKITAREIPERLMTFRLNMAPGEIKTFYFRHKTSSLISYHFKIFSDSELIISDRRQTFFQAFGYAFLIIIALVNILFAFGQEGKRFLYIAIFSGGMAVSYSIYEGVFQIITGIVIGEYRLTFLTICVGCAYISVAVYLRYITPSLKEHRGLNDAFKALAIFWLLMPILTFFPSISPHRWFIVGYMAAALYLVWPLLLGIQKQDIKSWHLPISILIYVFLTLLQGCHRLGLIEDFDGVGDSIRVGAIVLAFSMTLTLMDYIKSLKELIKSSNIKFRGVFDNMQDALVVLDENYRILEINKTAKILQEGDTSNLIGRSIFDDNLLTLSHENREKLSATLHLAKSGEQHQIELPLTLEDKETHQFNFSVIPYLMEGGDKYNILLSGRDLTESLQHKARMAAISTVLSENTGDKFFEALAVKLSELTGHELTMIASVNLQENTATTHAFYMDGEIQSNITYSLEGTPCDQVIGNGICSYHDGVAELFPDDDFLSNASLVSYTGMKLKSSSGETLGLIALLSRSPTKGQNLEDIMNIFSLRAGAEMERQKSLRKLIEAQQKLALHINHTPLGVINVDTNNGILEWNKAAEKIFGYSREEIVGHNAGETIFKDLSTQDFGMLMLNKNEGGQNVFAHERKDGSRIYCEWFVTPLIDGNQELGYAAMFEDVTMQKKILTALIRKEQEQSEILNSMADAAITIDENGTILSFNQAAEKTFEYTEKEVIGQSVNILMPTETASHHDAYIRRYIDTGEAQVIGQGREVEGLGKSGRVFPMRLMVSELPRAESGARRFIGTCHDLTNMKQKEQQLIQSQKMESIGKLTGGIAHDFNNILGIITGYTGLLTATAELDDAEESYIEEINHAAARGSTLTKKLLSLSKAKPLDSKQVNLDKAVNGMKDVIARTMTPRINVEFDLAAQSASILVDLSSLEDCLLNLCINAMHAMKNEGKLFISTQSDVVVGESQIHGNDVKPGLYHILSVRDTGEGIPQKMIDKVFDPFFSTKGDKGTGLGLSQAYGFMKQSEGFIELDSEVNAGTEFKLYFPKGRNGVESDKLLSIEEDLAAYAGTEKVLVVDDEMHLQKTTAALLKQSGYQVKTTGLPRQAISLVENEEFDFVLSDVVMPEMDGYELAKKLKTIKPEINIQLMSGYLSESVKQKVSDLGLKILVKPFSHRDLLYFVRSSIDAKNETSKYTPIIDTENSTND